jgi:hypothetical protein
VAKYAALLFTVVAVGVCIFQLALVLGAPWGKFTLGGRWQDRLPPKIRLIPVASLILLGFFCLVILARVKLVLPALHELSQSFTWLVVFYCAFGSLANAMTPSKAERELWLPVVLLMFVLSLVVATAG